MGKRKEPKAIVAEKGQVTIPKAIRDKLGIAPGTVLLFQVREDKLIVTREQLVDPVSSVYGCLKGTTHYTSTDDYLNEIRDPVQ